MPSAAVVIGDVRVTSKNTEKTNNKKHLAYGKLLAQSWKTSK